MPTYKTHIQLPDSVHTFFELLTAMGEVSFRPGIDDAVEFTLDAPDEWELAQVVHDLKVELGATFYHEAPDIPRPKLVETSTHKGPIKHHVPPDDDEMWIVLGTAPDERYEYTNEADAQAHWDDLYADS